jgi:hypothetical protein
VAILIETKDPCLIKNKKGAENWILVIVQALAWLLLYNYRFEKALKSGR